MIDATLLMTGSTVYSPWFPRQADMLLVTAELVAVDGASLTVKLYTKNASDTGDGNPVDTGTSIVLSSVGRSTAEWETKASQEGVEQLLRFRYEVTGEASSDWALFRLLPASWFDALTVPVAP
jgi:hypothetical protein